MKLTPLPLAGLTRIDTAPVADERGRFTRLYCDHALASLRPGLGFVQVNLSTTMGRGTVRGLHYQQPPAAEAKLIRCLRGKVFDVAVDLRAGSDTFLEWHAVELEEGVEAQVFIPEGFAHGFQVLSDEAQLLYFHTMHWQPEFERRLRADDPVLGIEWPLPIGRLSPADAAAPLLDTGFRGISP